MNVKIHRVQGQWTRRAHLQGLAAAINIKVVAVALCMLMPVLAQAFEERWESAAIGTYSPNDPFLLADEGTWFVGDTVSEFPECGPTPQKAEIIESGSSRALRLTSSDTNSECADDVWLALFDASRVGPLTMNQGFAIPLDAGTRIAFKQSGALSDAEQQGWGRDCIGPPCFDSVSLQLADNRGNILAYVLQRVPDAEPNVPNANFGDAYREIFLDPDAGTHNRDLFEDFKTIPDFVSSNAQVLSITLIVDAHGWAIFDDIAIGTDVAAPSPTPEPSREKPAAPFIAANGSANSAFISVDDNLSVSIALSANDYVGRDADMWLVANTPYGWFYYRYQTATWMPAGSSISDVAPTFQGGVSDLPATEVLNIVGLPPGSYAFYFGIDMDSNGQLDLDSLFFDNVVVNVAE